MIPIGRPVAQLAGYAPALPTPFDTDDNVDAAALEQLCHDQIRDGAAALVVCGTTGEAPTLTPREHEKIIRIAVGAANGRVPVIAGAGSNSTSHAIALAQQAEAAGADALLCVTPYYNKPTQAGLIAHFSAIAQSTGLPVILYDVPSRTACGLADETVARLAEMPQIIGLKDATGDVTRPARLRRQVKTEFRLFSGDDATAPAFLAFGGHGCISVTSNIAPGLCRSLYLACRQGQVGRAERLTAAAAKLTAALFCESNPVPVKYALSLFGIMSARVRLPLVGLLPDSKAKIAAVLAQMSAGYSDDMIAKFPAAHGTAAPAIHADRSQPAA
jgi:4-hydroxy-tetrahydrodipicolinate synthase